MFGGSHGKFKSPACAGVLILIGALGISFPLGSSWAHGAFGASFALRFPTQAKQLACCVPHSLRSFGPLGIEPSLRPPEGRVLPVYYGPFLLDEIPRSARDDAFAATRVTHSQANASLYIILPFNLFFPLVFQQFNARLGFFAKINQLRLGQFS